jgi:hypothetical protein
MNSREIGVVYPLATMAPMVSCCYLTVPAKLPVNLPGRGMVGIRIRISTFRSSRIAWAHGKPQHNRGAGLALSGAG